MKRSSSAIGALLAAAVGCGPVQDRAAAPPRASSDPWTIAVISDLHIPRDGDIPVKLRQVVAQVVARRPRLVVVTGDFTDGQPWDVARRTFEAPRWWRAARASLEPLRAAGIPVLPIAGNHDSCLRVYRHDYAAAWSDLARWAAPLELHGHHQPADGIALDAAPFSYSVDVAGVHLTLTHVVDEALDPAVAAWIASDLAAAHGATLRLVFGHMPLSSVVAEPSRTFVERFGRILEAGRADLYVAGHEHVVWDDRVTLPEGSRIRQLLVGTASASWRFGPTGAARRRAHCIGLDSRMHCLMPASGVAFELMRDRERWLETQPSTFTLITIDGATIAARAIAVDERGLAASFGIAPP